MVDAELVLEFQRGGADAFEELVRRHMKDAQRFCLRLTGGDPQAAEEISQEGFVNAYRALTRFRGESSFRSWLYRIFVNLNRDRIRSRKRYENRIAALQEIRPGTVDDDVAAREEARELSEMVRRKIALLPERQREVLILHFDRKLGYREIADILGISYENVKMNLSLARKRLREELRDVLEARKEREEE